MDFLKAQIAAKKRKATDGTQEEGASSKEHGHHKYVRRGEMERQEEIQARRSGRVQTEAHVRAIRAKEGGESEGKNETNTATSSFGEASSSRTRGQLGGSEERGKQEEEREAFNISNEEAIRRLRAKGEPIRLFDEGDKDRRLRLRALELIEERGEQMGQNDFMRAMRGAESSLLSHELNKKKREGSAQAENSEDGEEAKEDVERKEMRSVEREGVGMNSLLDLNLIKRDISKVYPIIYYTLKGLLRDWEQSLSDRPIEVRQSHQGKLVAATQVQTAEYLKPLFKQLRHRSVKPDVLARLGEIVHYVQKREYRHANDAYLQLSIGNAPWPIGVTMVGIHERSGREKIFSSNVAHALNDEVSRKYIQSLKRLMTFAQTKYPPENVSMLMG